MNLQEIMAETEKIGIQTSLRTFFRYGEYGLIPKSKKTNLGRYKGCIANYPEDTVSHFYAAWKMVKSFGIKTSMVKKIRRIALMAENETDTEKREKIWRDAIEARVSSPDERETFLRLVMSWDDLRQGLKPVITVSSHAGKKVIEHEKV